MNQVVIKVIGNYSYQTSRCLGEGVYGKVYEGQQRQTKEKVAIKKIDLATFTNDKYLQNAIFSEIYLLKRFNHQNIVKFKDVLSSKNSLYIITEFCQNGDLKEMIKKRRLNEEEAFQIMRQILSGFTQLVKQKIIHRDLKPANILISQKIFKIGDFGFAKYVDNFGSQMLKSCVGSPIYMAPQILQRTQYTTKCDIWSIGIIFYEMIHGYPPWKARDQTQLLKGIKTVPISSVLKKSNLSTRGNQFLKRTLAYSEEQRIGWNQLFENFGPRIQKIDKLLESAQKKLSIGTIQNKQRSRVVSANSVTNLSPYPSNNKTNSPLTPIGSGTNIPRNGALNINSYTNSVSSTVQNGISKKRNLFSGTNAVASNNQASHRQINSQDKKNSQIQHLLIWRKVIVHYHYFCLELFLYFSGITSLTNRPQSLAKLLLSISLFVKNRSTYCISMISAHAKTNKFLEDIPKKMQHQHQTYQMLHNDITILLQKLGIFKVLKSEMVGAVGHSDVINQQKMEKLQYFMISSANQCSQNLSEQIKKKYKNYRDIREKQIGFVQSLQYMLSILIIGTSKQKQKSLKEINDDQRTQDEDQKVYIQRIITKAEKLITII